MKRTVLVVLMVALVSTPCLAQEIKPDGIFSLHGTTWLLITSYPAKMVHARYLGFYEGKVFWSRDSARWDECQDVYPSFYVDLLAISYSTYKMGGGGGAELFWGIMSPLGFGVGFMIEVMGALKPEFFWPYLVITIKTNNNWTPPEVE